MCDCFSISANFVYNFVSIYILIRWMLNFCLSEDDFSPCCAAHFMRHIKVHLSEVVYSCCWNLWTRQGSVEAEGPSSWSVKGPLRVRRLRSELKVSATERKISATERKVSATEW